METAGERIRKLREGKNLTQTELSEMLGMKTYTTVSKWESNSNFPKGRDLKELAQLFNVSSDYLLGIEDLSKNDISYIYNLLEKPRKQKVYNFAEHQLEEQTKVISMEEYKTIKIQSVLSAGTGIIDLDPSDVEEYHYKGYVPDHDMAFKVKGNSMEPMFKDSEIIFVEKTDDIRSGQVIAVQINEESYIKKAYIEDNKLRLVSLNKEYKDIIADNHDDIRIVGRVIL